MGEGTLDLTAVDVPRGEETVRASVGLGHLVVIVPTGQDLLVKTDVGAGEVDVFGEQHNGVGFETREAYHGTGGTLILDLEVGMGQIEVRRGIGVRHEPVGDPDPTGSPDPTTPSTLG